MVGNVSYYADAEGELLPEGSLQQIICFASATSVFVLAGSV